MLKTALRRLPLRWRLVIGIVSLHAVLMTIFVSDLARRQQAYLRQEFVENAVGVAQVLAAASVPWIMAENTDGLETVLDAQRRIPDALRAMALSPGGRLLAHTDHALTGQYVDDPFTARLRTAKAVIHLLVDDENLLDIACPVMNEGRFIGWARVAFSKASVNGEARSIAWRSGLWLALTILVGLALALVTAQSLTRGIGHLMTVVKNFKDGDEGIRADLERGDELGRLAASMNDMLDAVARQRRITEEARAQLAKALYEYEAIVVSLQDANQQLNDEVEKRGQAEQSLLAEKERLSVTLASITEGVIACDLHGLIVLMNSVAEGLTGWTFGDARGRPATEIFRLTGRQSGPLPEDPLRRAMDQGRVTLLPEATCLLGRDGLSLSVSGSCAPIRDQVGRPIGGIFVFHDTSAQEAIREQMFKIRKLESLGVLAGGLAHDFNNILTGILGNIGMARMRVASDDPLTPLLTGAENAAGRARRLTEQLLTFAKGGEPVRQSAQIEEIIRDTCQFTLAGSSTRARFEIPADIHWVYMDSGQISQVIQNIVLNAAEAMRGSGGEIVVSCANCHIGPGEFATDEPPSLPLTEGDYVRARFVDDGPGIEAKHLGRIFDPYFTTKETGNGLGLAICHSIIRKHNGHIDVVSPAPSGRGTMFTLWLPASSEAPPRAATSGGDFHAAKGVVLVVDDDEIIREVVGKMLGAAGYTVLFAKEGREALAIYSERLDRRQTVDCVILDLTIPGGMGGKSAMDALLRLDPQAKGIVTSGYVGDSVVTDYSQHGFVGAITKPFTLSELLAVVRRVTA
ncbi:MAG: response regulator [Desulfobulbaceae bacterium]|jgi:signal transduction histidine kinase/HAMP domain-containing protein/ActR/RegA family two-component response regulator|nr:response regulator [Desulfobulbaceae bacterium]